MNACNNLISNRSTSTDLKEFVLHMESHEEVLSHITKKTKDSGDISQ